MGRLKHVDVYPQFPLTIERGTGTRVYDAGGRAFWDLYGGHAVALLGHAHPDVTRAVAEQCARLTFYSNVVPLAVRDAAAERLLEFAGAHFSAVFFCNSGAEANENALKLALQYTGRRKVAGLAGGFHGRTFLTLAAGDSPKLKGPFADVLCPSLTLRPNDVGDLARIDATVAAVIVEPIQSMAGVVVLSAEYLQALRQRCSAVGAWLIYDEIQTGMGRLGKPLAAGEYGVWPEMSTLAKGIANGIPMGAVLFAPAVGEQVKMGDLGATFGGGPVACAAHLAVLDVLAREDLLSHARAVEDAVRRGCIGRGGVREVLGRGCLLGLRLDGDAKSLQQALLERGFLTGTSGDPRVLRLLPPVNTPLEAIEELAEALADVEAPAGEKVTSDR